METGHSDPRARDEDAARMESLGRLSGGVAHDYNNMLSVILNYSDFALEGLRDLAEAGADHAAIDAVRRDIEAVHEAAERAAVLTRRLLVFGTPQGSPPEDLRLNAVVEGFASLLRRVLGEHISILMELDPSDPQVCADRLAVEHTLVRLALEARSAMPSGGSLRLTTSSEVADGGDGDIGGPTIMMSVLGNGAGRSAFETVRSEGNIRVGLSRDGEPRATISFPTAARAREPDASAATPRETILLAEDDEGVRAAAQRVLTSAGYTVLHGADAHEVIEVARSHTESIDLLLADVIMPSMSGPELAERFTHLYPSGKVAFMSGYSREEIEPYAHVDEDAVMLRKPFTGMTLLRAVRTALSANVMS